MAITAKMEGKKLVITTDVNGTELSASMKNINRATTGGFVTVEGTNLRFALNVIEKPAK